MFYAGTSSLEAHVRPITPPSRKWPPAGGREVEFTASTPIFTVIHGFDCPARTSVYRGNGPVRIRHGIASALSEKSCFRIWKLPYRTWDREKTGTSGFDPKQINGTRVLLAG